MRKLKIVLLASCLASSAWSQSITPGGGGGGGGGTTPCSVGLATWVPTDQSGAGLVFTGVSAQYCTVGNLVFAYGKLTYPTTSDSSSAAISLPVAVPNQTYAAMISNNSASGVSTTAIQAVVNSSPGKANVINTNSGAAITNSVMSTRTITFMLVYPAS